MARQSYLIGKKIISIGVYSSVLELIIVTTTREVTNAAKSICRKIKENCEGIPTKCSGYCIGKGRKYFIILAEDKITWNDISHETYHCTEYIIQFNSVVEDDNREAAANLNGFINQEVITAIKEFGVEIG